MSQPAASIRPAANVQRRSQTIRAAITVATEELEQLQRRQRELIAGVPEDPKDAADHTRFLREVAVQIQAVHSRITGLNEQHLVASELDADEAYHVAEDEFLGHIAFAKKQLNARAAIGVKLTATFAQLGALLQELDDVNASANRHLSAAAAELPRKHSVNFVHAARQMVNGGYATHALLKALMNAGVGSKGITASVMFDAGGDRIASETFEQAIARSTDRIESQLNRWVDLARGDTESHPIGETLPPPPPPPPKEIKWADQTDIGFGGQAPRREHKPYA